MKKLLLLFLFLASVLFSGCPYTSKVPIDNPGIKVESNYFGIWLEEKVLNSKYEISGLNEFEYLIVQVRDTTIKDDAVKLNDGSNDPEYEEEKSAPTTYTGHISKIKEYSFLNLKEKSDNLQEDNQYSIYKIDFTGNSEFRLTEITSLIKEQFDNTEDLKNYIEKYMDSGISFFYGAEYVYQKQN